MTTGRLITLPESGQVYECRRCAALVHYDDEGADWAEHERFHADLDEQSRLFVELTRNVSRIVAIMEERSGL